MHSKTKKFHTPSVVACLLVAGYLGFVKPQITAAQVSADGRKQYLVDWYVQSGGEDSKVVTELGGELINELLARLKNREAYPSQGKIIFALEVAIQEVPDAQDAKVAGKAAIYEMLKSKDPWTRSSAVRCIATLDKENATDALVAMLNDPDETVRISVAQSVGRVGRTDSVNAVQQVLSARAKGLTPEQIRRDSSFEFGHRAIERLRARAQGEDIDDAPKLEPTER